MAVKFATRYGLQNRTSVYGDLLTAGDGNGDTFGEMTVSVENDPVTLQLADIAAMRSEIGRNPLPGDDVILEYLEFDEAVLRSGMEDDYISPVLATYPDMPDILRETVEQNPDVIRNFDTEQPELALAAFREAPVEFLRALEREEAHTILQQLTMRLLEESYTDTHALAA